MQAQKILEMLNNGKINELIAELQDEIYQESLKRKPNAKKRYTAMKKYFSYTDSGREVLKKPCAIEFEGEKYTSFTNSWSLVLTKEDIGEIELFDEANGKYPDVGRLLRFDGIKRKVDFGKLFAEAKSKGYKLNKTEVNAGFKYLLHYDGTYYKVGLVDMSYRIIDTGEEAMVYYPDGKKMPMTIQTDLGFCMIMPVWIKDEDNLEEKVIIEMN